MAMSARSDAYPQWRRSSLCADNACVEVAHVGDTTMIRDSKLDHASPVLAFSSQAWADLCVAIKNGDFD